MSGAHQGSADIPGTLLADVHDTYLQWLGDDYDLGALNVVLCAAAAEKLSGDPPWLLVVGGSGAAKTESVAPLAGAGGHIISTINGEAALLSGTPAKSRAKNATGGLLRKIGPSGVLVIKDFTSILSMNRDTRAHVLAALREIYDGHWSRNVGTDGGFTLTWRGRIVVIGAVTTAWDSAYQVVSTMGDRFALVRLRTGDHRRAAGLQAMGNVGDETAMREQLAAVTGKLLAGAQAYVSAEPEPRSSATTRATRRSPTGWRCRPGSPSNWCRSPAAGCCSASTAAPPCGWPPAAAKTPCRRCAASCSPTSPATPARSPPTSPTGCRSPRPPSTAPCRSCSCSACWRSSTSSTARTSGCGGCTG